MIKIDRVEINITELCNRTCFFCPRAHGYENANLHMTPEVAEQAFIQTEKYTNKISMAGRGEPLLGKYLYEICDLSIKYNKEMKITTNGDKLDKHINELDKILDLKTNTEKLLVNCYDGIEQEKEWSKTYSDYTSIKFDSKRQTVDIESHKKNFFGDLTNRGGYISLISDKNSELHRGFDDHPCYFLYFKTFVNYNGDINLCCHDWKIIKNFGNIMKTNFSDIWERGLLNHYRQELKNGHRSKFLECANCDSVQEWKRQEYYYNNYGKYYE